jgi:hypothetical protein
MSRYLPWAGLVAAVVACIALYVSQGQSAPAVKEAKAPKWEYKVLSLSDTGVVGVDTAWEKALNKAGEEGWEVVGSVPKLVRGASTEARVLLKRLKK